MGEERGSIGFFATYRPPVAVDIFTCPVPPKSMKDEFHMTDGLSYNYNCQVIPPEALKAIINRLKSAKRDGVDYSGVKSGFVFVSERHNGLELLYIALRFSDSDDPNAVKVFSLSDIYGSNDFNGVRMEDSGCIAGGFAPGVDYYLVYVSTKEPVTKRRSPWTVVYKTNLTTGKTDRLTPQGLFDLSPCVSPSGKMVAVASFERNGWKGEIEDLKTDIFVMNLEKPNLDRKMVVENGGWPTWGSDNFIFFHRKVGDYWGVFRFDISSGNTVPVTPQTFHANTPAAISATKVAVATRRKKSDFDNPRKEADQYRHIEIFDMAAAGREIKITQASRPLVDHFNPFVMDGGNRIGYHRAKPNQLKSEEKMKRSFFKVDSPNKDVGLFRVSGVFPTFSPDGSKLAFVDNEFKAVWVADKEGLGVVFEAPQGIKRVKDGKQVVIPNNVFSTVWNQNPEKDILYVCVGPPFTKDQPLHIYAIPTATKRAHQRRQLTKNSKNSNISNNAFPSTNPDGTKLVFRSTRDGQKNLYIMENVEVGEFGDGKITRITEGEWTDTHCQWSPRGNWIVCSSTRDKPQGKLPDLDKNNLDNGLDPGYFAVFLVKPDAKNVYVRVIISGDNIAGHVNHPFFSPDGRSIAVTADLAAVAVDPISLPIFVHSVRPYGELFTVDIDLDYIEKEYRNNKIKVNESYKYDVKEFKRITHSRYEASTPIWFKPSTENQKAIWDTFLNKSYTPTSPYFYPEGGENFELTGHLCLGRRCC